MLSTANKSVLALLVAVTGSALAVTGMVSGPATAAVPSTISIDDPAASGPVRAGDLALTGSLFQGPAETTTVLYAVDATGSTAEPTGADCDGGGYPNAADDLNGDNVVGDTLDCEIAAVRAIDADLAASAGRLQVGLVAFARDAAAADLNPDGSALFVSPGYTGGDAVPRVVAAAASVKRFSIDKFDVRDLGGSGDGTAFDDAVGMALATLAQAPPGPKWVMFLSDGQAPHDAATVQALTVAAHDSGVRLRSFAIGGNASCNPNWGLAELAAATGEACVEVAKPALLAASLQGSTPESVTGVSVTVGGVAFAADVDPVGGWRVGIRIGKGTYTAIATATLSSGATVSDSRTFTVTDAAPGSVAPPAGSVSGTGGTLLATQVAVRRPAPSRAALSRRVTGTVGTPGKTPKATKLLDGATVLLQGRGGAGAPWVTVARSTVRSGDFALRWKRRTGVRSLRVALQSYHQMAASSAAVPVARISACRKVDGAGARWTLTCHTTAKKGAAARLLVGKRLVDRAKVAKGLVAVTGSGKTGRYVLVVDVSRRTHLRLSL